ncbi:MAG: helix-turn-helix domain-containing protein [Rubricella sp.]
MAFSHPHTGNAEEMKRLRRQAGRMLREMRLKVEKTQRAVAEEIGFEYYTMVSQIESGKTRVPPLQIVPYARALRVSPRELARKLMRYYDPVTFEILFTDKYEA